MRRLFLILTLIFVPVFAFGDVQYVKILLPVVLNEPVPGGYGSQWITRTSITNVSDVPIAVDGYEFKEGGCHTDCPPTPDLPPGITFYPLFPLYNHEPAWFLLVDREHMDEIEVHLRAQDISRQAQTWGTEIPVVREDDAATERIALVDIPSTSEFRTMVRLYAFDPDVSEALHVKLYAIAATNVTPFQLNGDPRPADTLVTEVDVTLTAGNKYTPGYATLGPETFPLDAATTTYRIEITPVRSGMRFWAFASVTNNMTQHVTVVTPQSSKK